MEDRMTAQDLADLLGVGRQLIYAETRAGKFPHVKVGRRYFYSREEITRWTHEESMRNWTNRP